MLSLCAIIIGFLGLLPRVAGQNLIANGGFENPALPEGNNYILAPNFNPWQTTDSQFEIWTPGASDPAPQGRQHLEILAFTNDVRVSQTIDTVPGQDYVLTFYHSPRPGVESVLSVKAGSDVLAILTEDGSELTQFRWLPHRVAFTAESNRTTIAFSDRAASAAGTHIDDVSVEERPLALTIRTSELEICWETVPNNFYQLQYRSSLTGNNWTNSGMPIRGDGTKTCIEEVVLREEPKRFYRLLSNP